MRIFRATLVLLLFGFSDLAVVAVTPTLIRDADGNITRKQATAIAEAYFEKNMGGCGGVSEPSLTKSYWLFPYLVGYAGAPGKHPIAVSLSTGAVGCPGFPLIRDPIPLLQSHAAHDTNSSGG